MLTYNLNAARPFSWLMPKSLALEMAKQFRIPGAHSRKTRESLPSALAGLELTVFF